MSISRPWFYRAFDRAATFCREFGQQFVVEALPESLRFDFAAAVRDPAAEGKIKYLGGRLLARSQLTAVEPWVARKYLWVDERIPLWINLRLCAADREHTYIEVATSGNLTADPDDFYHKREGNPPFHVLGPPIPHDWISVAASGKVHIPRRCSPSS
jgi:hypothetical protein